VDWVIVFFRVVHVPAAIAWAGGAIFFSFYIEPTMAKLGPDAEKFVNEIINVKKAPIYFTIVSTLTVLGGAVLYYHDAGGLQLWTSPTGWVFTIGAVCGILAWASGGAVLAPAIKKLGAVGAQIKAAGGPPSAELMAQMHAAQERVKMIGQIDTALIIVAVVTMATARYFG
jgi:uncharacterized membrane protein